MTNRAVDWAAPSLTDRSWSSETPPPRFASSCLAAAEVFRALFKRREVFALKCRGRSRTIQSAIAFELW